MPWHVEERHAQCPADRPFAVVKDGTDEVEGCHPSKEAADRQVKALYASEKSLVRIDHDALGSVVRKAIGSVSPKAEPKEQTVRVEVASARDEFTGGVLAALQGLLERIERIETGLALNGELVERLEQAARERDQTLADVLELVGGSLGELRAAAQGAEPPVVNVTVPEPVVNVDVAAAAAAPPAVEVSCPQPVVNVEVSQPARRKRVSFERDLSGRIVSAEITEEVAE
jgi:hypothetical protein